MANVFQSGMSGNIADMLTAAQTPRDPNITVNDDRIQMIRWRLRKHNIGLGQMNTTLTADKVHFTCTAANGDFIHLEDDSDLFPSDAFIAALRLLIP